MSDLLELNTTDENETLNLDKTIVYGEIDEIESCRFCESTFGQRMIEYYPKVISKIQEYKAIISSEYPEIEALDSNQTRVLNDSTLLYMSEERVIQWEKILGIKPIEGSTVDDRRDTIIARIRGQGKLNTDLINSIVNAFTGGTAESWIENSTLYVSITPPRNNKQYQFANVEQELKKKVPAHLAFQVSRNYYTWEDINKNFTSWTDMKSSLPTWEDVYLYIPFV